MLIARLKSSSVELLVTNRYIDADVMFFGVADNNLAVIDSFNDGLNNWHAKPDSSEKWFLNTEATAIQNAKLFKGLVMTQRGKIAERF